MIAPLIYFASLAGLGLVTLAGAMIHRLTPAIRSVCGYCGAELGDGVVRTGQALSHGACAECRGKWMEELKSKM